MQPARAALGVWEQSGALLCWQGRRLWLGAHLGDHWVPQGPSVFRAGAQQGFAVLGTCLSLSGPRGVVEGLMGAENLLEAEEEISQINSQKGPLRFSTGIFSIFKRIKK